MAAVLSGRGSDMTTIDVQLRAQWLERTGHRYDVLLDSEVIVHRSRDPEHDAARALHARGLRGRFRLIDFSTGRPRTEVDIGKAAKLRTVERDDGPLSVMRYRLLSDEVRAALNPHTFCQGRQIADGAALDNPDPAKAAGGETCAGSRRVPEESRARLHRACQEWPLVPDAASDTPPPAKPAGGECGAAERRHLRETGDQAPLAPNLGEHEDA